MSNKKETPCAIYKTAKRDGLYLYVKEQDDFSDVPTEVMQQFPRPEHVFDLQLSVDKKLAREDVNKVIKNLQSQGFHLQMPPKQEAPIDVINMPDSLHG
ncbi:MAG: YcgL domain-containing protein [Cycloclasticus sp.]|nr:YcgL domain-containing protein [Cycloclasticus sp.]MBQ0789805.1 YcgL domain-containing protein [Cycloclasticus sp.]